VALNNGGVFLLLGQGLGQHSLGWIVYLTALWWWPVCSRRSHSHALEFYLVDFFSPYHASLFNSLACAALRHRGRFPWKSMKAKVPGLRKYWNRQSAHSAAVSLSTESIQIHGKGHRLNLFLTWMQWKFSLQKSCETGDSVEIIFGYKTYFKSRLSKHRRKKVSELEMLLRNRLRKQHNRSKQDERAVKRTDW
jgi:hypothetical protein